MQDEGEAILQSVARARECSSRGEHEECSQLLLQCLILVPELWPELEDELAESLAAYAEALGEGGGKVKACALYQQAIGLKGGTGRLWTDYGTLLLSFGHATEAMKAYERALVVEPENWQALECLENVKSLAVDRWFFRMLNDGSRNEAYQAALRAAVAEKGPNATVCDIGTGTGLLAMFAIKAGAKHVYACEVNAVLCSLAMEIIAHHGMSDRITVIHASSTELVRGRQGFPAQGVDIVVTELVDSGLLGEKIIPVLQHASQCLLRKGGRVIPSHARVTASLLQSPDLRSRRAGSLGSPAAGVRLDESYTCEPLSQLQHVALTGEVMVMELPLIGMAGSSPIITRAELPVLCSGVVDAVAVTWEMFLGPDGSFPVSSRSGEVEGGGRVSGWDEALFFCRPFEVCCAEGEVKPSGSTVLLEATHSDDRLIFRFPEHQVEEDPTCLTTFEVGEADMKKLNDMEGLEKYLRAAEAAVASARANVADMGETVHVLELAGNWFSVGLSLVQRLEGVTVTSVTDSADSRSAFTAVAEESGLAHRYRSIASGNQLVLDRRYSVVVVDLVEVNGLIRQNVLQDVAWHVRSPCRAVPSAVQVIGQLISCDSLGPQNSVVPEATCGLDLSLLDRFGVAAFQGIDLATLPHAALTAPFLCGCIDAARPELAPKAPQSIAVKVTEPGVAVALAFWFDLSLDDCTHLITRSTSLASYHRQACCMLPLQPKLLAGETITLSVRLTPGGTVTAAVTGCRN